AKFTNMVMVRHDGTPCRYKEPEEIIEEWYPHRLDLYVTRRKKELKRLKAELNEARNKMRFIEAVNSKEFNLKRDDDELEGDLEEQGYDKVKGSFDYLLNMHVRSLTM